MIIFNTFDPDTDIEDTLHKANTSIGMSIHETFQIRKATSNSS